MSDTFVTEDLAVQLGNFGLNRIEAAIYLHLVNKHSQTILDISRALNLPRTSVYDNAVKLADKGLIEKVVTFKSQKLRAYPPDILQTVVDQEKVRVEALQSELKNLQQKVASLVPASSKTEVRYYSGKAGFRQMLWNTLRSKEIIGYSEFGRAEIVGEDFTLKLHDEILRRGIIDRVITNPAPEMLKHLTNPITGMEKRSFQQTKVLPADQLYVSGDTSIYNNTFALNYWKQGEAVGVEIDNAELVKTQKSIFELLWKLAKPVEPYLTKKQ
jgi:sugar-specific transcriptional regulator TrmB